MVKYHITERGDVKICRASLKPCPVSPMDEHFADRSAALGAAEKKLSAEFASAAPGKVPTDSDPTSTRREQGPDGAVTSSGEQFLPAGEVRGLPPHIPADLQKHRTQAKTSLAHLSEVEQIALKGYGGFAAGVANSYLLGNTYEPYAAAPPWRTSGGPTDFHSLEELRDYISVVDGILAPRAEEPRILYRGIPIYEPIHRELEELVGSKFRAVDSEKLKEGLEKYFPEGKVFEYHTYLSTSSSADEAAERTDNVSGTAGGYYDGKPELLGIQLELKTSAGVDITGSVKAHYAREREVVLPRGLKFRVEKLILAPQAYRTFNGEEEETYTGIAAVVQLVEVEPEATKSEKTV
jgi:hypothetical protein